ncbi:MAG TPA: RNA methyltransferase [Gammaproteobacteria bacterium]
MFEALENIRVVLVNTSHPGNIGAAARAMKTMGLTRLYLVEPLQYPCAEATARASGADDVLAGAVVCGSLTEAVGDCRLVIGTSARERRLEWPLLLPDEAAGQLVREASRGEVALVFGRERFGLTNEELDACHFLVNIPANPDYSSLNLAAAVQVLCYELRRNCGRPRTAVQPVTEEDLPAMAEEVEGFYAHLEETLCHIGLMTAEEPKTSLLRRLRRLYQRTRLTRTEVNILRGILTATQKRRLP